MARRLDSATAPPPRRRFLKASGAVVAAAVAPVSTVRAASQTGGGDASRSAALDPDLLAALAETVLPGEIGVAGIDEALRDFRRWLDGFEPVAEMPHPYLSSDEVRFGPPDPAPNWASQLAGLDLLAQKRHGGGFVALALAERRELVAAEVSRAAPADGGLPAPSRASHVALGLMARFYARPAAADRAYGARINARACRDLAGGAMMPTQLEAEAGGR